MYFAYLGQSHWRMIECCYGIGLVNRVGAAGLEVCQWVTIAIKVSRVPRARRQIAQLDVILVDRLRAIFVKNKLKDGTFIVGAYGWESGRADISCLVCSVSL